MCITAVPYRKNASAREVGANKGQRHPHGYKRKRARDKHGMYWDKKMGGLKSTPQPPKQTLEMEGSTRISSPHLSGSGGTGVARKQGRGGLIKSFIVIFKSVFRQFFVMEVRVPGKAWSNAAGFSNPVKSLLLERSQPLSVEMSLIKGAGSGGSPMFLSAVRALDDVVFGVSTGGSGVHGGFMVAGANRAPSRL